MSQAVARLPYSEALQWSPSPSSLLEELRGSRLALQQLRSFTCRRTVPAPQYGRVTIANFRNGSRAVIRRQLFASTMPRRRTVPAPQDGRCVGRSGGAAAAGVRSPCQDTASPGRTKVPSMGRGGREGRIARPLPHPGHIAAVPTGPVRREAHTGGHTFSTMHQSGRLPPPCWIRGQMNFNGGFAPPSRTSAMVDAIPGSGNSASQGSSDGPITGCHFGADWGS